MNKSTSSTLVKTIKTISKVIGVILLAYVIFIIYSAVQYYPTIGALEHIKNSRLTMQDVTGETLPPKRTEAEYEATIEGLDENTNGIRDDVEHAIFEMEGDSLQMRAAKLQYAQALQLYFSSVRDGETWISTVKKISIGGDCITNTAQGDGNSPLASFDLYDKATDKLSNAVFNTDMRQKVKEVTDNTMQEVYSIGIDKINACDIKYE